MEETIEKSQALAAKFEVIEAILEKNHRDPSRMIPILQEIQDTYKYLSKDVINYVASSLRIPASRVYGVATFYAHFSMSPKGRHILRICDGTACHVKKSHAILEMLSEKLGITDEKHTTSDLMFTIELVSCLGACGLAPVVVVDDEVHGQSTPTTVGTIIDDIIAKENAAKAEQGK